MVCHHSPASLTRDAIHREQSQFAAHVHVKSTLPTLLLEDNDPHFERIACYGSTIEISFHSDLSLSLAWTELAKHHEMLIITSHLGCNANGERRPFRVSEAKKMGNSLVLSVTPVTWKNSFHSIDVHFGSRVENNELKSRGHPQKRQAAPSLTASAAAVSSINFPSAPSVSPSNTSVADASVNKQYLDTAILPPKFPGVEPESLQVPFVPQGLSVGCKNCTIQGSIDVSHGYFSISNANSTSNSSNIVDLLMDGYVELQINNFAAHVELESTIQPSASLFTYVAPFPDIGIPGFSIPGIAVVGPVLRPRVSFGAQISTELDFTYGFNVSIPNNSTIMLNIGDLENSTITGFQHSKVSTLPFQSQLNNINLTLSAAFTPQLLLTISVLDDLGSVSAGAFLDLPSISATVAQVNHVNDKCERVNATGSAKDLLFNSLTHITSSVNADVGVLAEAELRAGDFVINDTAAYTAWSTGYSLPTACFSYDANKSSYATPTAKPSRGPAAPSGRAVEEAKLGIGDLGVKNPLMGFREGSGRIKGVILLMGLFLVGFGAL
ncbi:MAG: hypothetical protein Q9217_001949 [Psora testacea]